MVEFAHIKVGQAFDLPCEVWYNSGLDEEMMMAAEKRDNSGLLGDNDRKLKDSHPDKKGSCIIDGVEYWISGWDKDGQYGPFVSLAFQKKEDAKKYSEADEKKRSEFAAGSTAKPMNKDAPKGKEAPKGKFDNFDDDVPF
jgi:hypothetical protein